MPKMITDPQSPAAQRAVELAVQGKKAFETPGGLNMEAENAEMAAAGFGEQEPTPQPVAEEHKDLAATAEVSATAGEEAAPVPGIDVDFSTNPIQRLEEMLAFFQKMLPDAALPDKGTLALWKTTHMDVFFVPLNGKLYIYRYIKRQEWNQLQVDASWQNADVNQRKEMIYNRCLLWPQLLPQEAAAEPAGIQDTLVAQIEAQSGWLDAYELASTTFKL